MDGGYVVLPECSDAAKARSVCTRSYDGRRSGYVVVWHRAPSFCAGSRSRHSSL